MSPQGDKKRKGEDKDFVQLTVRLELRPDGEQVAAMEKTRAEYGAAFDAASKAGWEAKRINGNDIHRATYRKVRKAGGLPSQLVISARMKAVEDLKSVRALKKQGRKVSRPVMKNPTIRFDARSFRLDWKDLKAHLTLSGGRITLPVSLCKFASKYRGLPTASADLVKRGKRWFFHVVVNKEKPKGVKPTGRVIGVDRGIRRPAVTSAGIFLGKPCWRAIEERLMSLRQRLQAKGTGSAKRHFRRLEDRLARFRRDCDHVLAKKLVASCEPGDMLVFEDLTHIRDNAKAKGRANRRRLHAWTFRRLESIVGYKAALAGVLTDKTDAWDTSRRCPKCGHVDGANRRTQAVFRCVRCGFERNADLVAAWNIRDRHRGLWAPVPRVPGRVNGPNVEEILHFFCKPRTLVRGG
jgi:IS605 OrfB family transposase